MDNSPDATTVEVEEILAKHEETNGHKSRKRAKRASIMRDLSPVIPSILTEETQPVVEPETIQETQQPVVEPETTPEPQQVVEPETTPETQQVIEPETTPETQQVVEPETIQETQQVVEPDTTPEPQPVVEPETTPETQPVVEPETTPETQPVVEPETIQETQPVVEPETTPEPQPVVEPETTPEPQPVVEPEKKTPKLVFIIPYRDREQQLQFFSKQMAVVLSSYSRDDVRLFYVHQCDNRSFNRGAMKNIGFLTVKKEYPETYRDITLVFNDIDTMPFSADFLKYETTHGKVKHFYGYTFALGGIISITAGDFEKLCGFPNLWTWGYEDNLLNYRVLINKEIEVDRSQFYPIMDKNILHLNDGLHRTINRKEFDVYINETTEGYHSITGLNTLLEPRKNDGRINETFVQVLDFNTGRTEDTKISTDYNITNGSRPFGDVKQNTPVLHRRGSARMGLVMR